MLSVRNYLAMAVGWVLKPTEFLKGILAFASLFFQTKFEHKQYAQKVLKQENTFAKPQLPTNLNSKLNLLLLEKMGRI